MQNLYVYLLEESNKSKLKKATVNFENLCVFLDSLYGFSFFCKICKDMGKLFYIKKLRIFRGFIVTQKVNSAKSEYKLF